jgi:hypothetical protein
VILKITNNGGKTLFETVLRKEIMLRAAPAERASDMGVKVARILPAVQQLAAYLVVRQELYLQLQIIALLKAT